MSVFEIITEDEFKGSGTVIAMPAGTDNIVPDVLTYPCNFCGHCETPNDCAWSHTCPVCEAPAGVISVHSMCKTPTGGIVGIHAERWKGVKS